MKFSKQLSILLYLALVIGIGACGSSEDPIEPEDPDQTINIRADYVGSYITTLQTLQQQEIGLIRENDSTVRIFTYPGSEVTDGFVAQVDDLSSQDLVTIFIPYQIVGGDTIQGVGVTIDIAGQLEEYHGTYNKVTQRLEYSITRQYWNEEFQETYVIDEIFDGFRR